MILKFLSYLKNNYAVIIFAAFLVILAFLFVGCQGLANANGDNNQIVISREVDDVLH